MSRNIYSFIKREYFDMKRYSECEYIRTKVLIFSEGRIHYYPFHMKYYNYLLLNRLNFKGMEKNTVVFNIWLLTHVLELLTFTEFNSMGNKIFDFIQISTPGKEIYINFYACSAANEFINVQVKIVIGLLNIYRGRMKVIL